MNDIMVGMRVALSDAQSSEILLGAVFDRGSSARFVNIEASRRIGANWKFVIEGRGFVDVPTGDRFNDMRKDSYLNLQMARYF